MIQYNMEKTKIKAKKLSKSVRVFIRREKARIRQRVSDAGASKRAIEELNVRFRPASKRK